MTSLRSLAYAALLAFTALNFSPKTASAQEPTRGKFTLTHAVQFGNAKILAGDYEFAFDPNATSRMLSLSKLSPDRTAYLVVVPSIEDTKPADKSRLILKTTRDGSYVSVMQLPQLGMTLVFAVPPHAAERQIAKASTTGAASSQ
ncbi:MAG TPA: hypothetical protein VH350_16535 [Candidatus Sulfotelmatobacter sp.]|jgi:hypothetical protein|nr:hypothetical protein [Candidatus Sulfotelmatobacter sp.]